LIQAPEHGQLDLSRRRLGRRNQYTINTRRPLCHPMEQRHRIGELLDLLRE
jgi:hypothetical protein